MHVVTHPTDNITLLGDGDTQCDKMFLQDLKAAHTICTKESKGSVTVKDLAKKYLETHSNEVYRDNLKGKELKLYLVESSHFIVIENLVTIIEGESGCMNVI